MNTGPSGLRNGTTASSADPPHPTPDLGRGTLRGLPFRLARSVLLPFVRALVGLRLEGIEHVPADGPLIVICNHLHNADPILLSIAFPRPVHFMAKKETFAYPFIAAIIRRVGAFPVDRGKADRSAIKRAEATIAQGIPIGMFPEGTRSQSAALQPAHPGAAMIALRTNVPILPIAITGTERLPFNGKARPSGPVTRTTKSRARVVIRFGEPFQLAPTTTGHRLAVEAATTSMMGRIADLLPPSYRGGYADSAAAHDAHVDPTGSVDDTA